jgi:hypothetical protein
MFEIFVFLYVFNQNNNNKNDYTLLILMFNNRFMYAHKKTERKSIRKD